MRANKRRSVFLNMEIWLRDSKHFSTCLLHLVFFYMLSPVLFVCLNVVDFANLSQISWNVL